MKQPKLTQEQQHAIRLAFFSAKQKIKPWCEKKHGFNYNGFYGWATGLRTSERKDAYIAFEEALLTDFGLKVR